MKTPQKEKAPGANLLDIVGTIILIIGIVAAIGLIFIGEDSASNLPISIGILIGSLFLYAISVNISNINDKIHQLYLFKKEEAKQKVFDETLNF